MKELVYRIIAICILVMLPGYISAQETWRPPEAPDLITGTPISFLERAVVKIESTWYEFGEVIYQESGAGISLGVRRDKFYIMTAAHVVRNKVHGSANDIKVMLKRSPREYYDTELIDYDQERDFAVLATTRVITLFNEQDRESVVKMPIGYSYVYKAEKIVKVIGHPKNDLWKEITTETVKSSNPSLMRLKRSSIGYGNSGGPVLSESHQLIGMVTAMEGDNAYALKITEILEVLEEWDIPYRSRFLSGDLSKNFALIFKAMYNSDEIENLSDKRYTKETLYSGGEPIELFRPKVALFNRDLAILAKDRLSCPLVGDNERKYYIELVGDYFFENKASLDEAWRILVRNIGNLVPAGYSVRQEGYTIDFSKFKILKGRMHIRIEESNGRLFVVIGTNLECVVMRLGASISRLDHNLKSFLQDRRRVIEQK